MNKLVDNFGRQITYLRLSVTDRCNLRCTYCMDEHMTFLPRSQVLSLEELEEVARAFVSLGIKKIRLTGGEPLIRQGIIGLCKKISALEGLEQLVMTTNAVLLEQQAQELRDAGVSKLNISIDSLNPIRFQQLTRFGALPEVLRGIDAAVEAGFDNIKLNTVILKGVNDDEIAELAQFSVDKGIDISFIEEMPLGQISSHQRSDTQIASQTLFDSLSNEFGLSAIEQTDAEAGPSRYFRVNGSNSKIGFISPITNNFCSSCNRVRLTTEGQLLLCLGNEHSVDLKQIMREDSEESVQSRLQRAIHDSMTIKPERHHFDPNETTIVRFMSATGG